MCIKMPLKKTSTGYVCPLGILKNTYLEGFDAVDNPIILGNCGMCTFGDRSAGTKLDEMCQAPTKMTLEWADELWADFEKEFKNREKADMNKMADRRAYWGFIRGKINR